MIYLNYSKLLTCICTVVRVEAETPTLCPNYTRRDRIPVKCSLAVHTTRDATESIKYHSQSEECVDGLSLEAHWYRKEMSMFII